MHRLGERASETYVSRSPALPLSRSPAPGQRLDQPPLAGRARLGSPTQPHTAFLDAATRTRLQQPVQRAICPAEQQDPLARISEPARQLRDDLGLAAPRRPLYEQVIPRPHRQIESFALPLVQVVSARPSRPRAH